MKNASGIFAAVLEGNITKLEHTDQVVAGWILKPLSKVVWP